MQKASEDLQRSGAAPSAWNTLVKSCRDKRSRALARNNEFIYSAKQSSGFSNLTIEMLHAKLVISIVPATVSHIELDDDLGSTPNAQ
jgi:hypothetical protein